MGNMVLSNLKALRDDMKKQGWTISSFIFVYKKIEYVVLVKLFEDKDKKKNKYALVKLCFLRHGNTNDMLEVEANSYGLIVEVKTLIEYFNIEFKENIADIMAQFCARLAGYIPSVVLDNISEIQKIAMVKSLSISDSQSPDKIYCTKIKRNPKGYNRTVFNSNKTRILRPTLYDIFKDDSSVSFCYDSSAAKENDDSTILKNFALQKA